MQRLVRKALCIPYFTCYPFGLSCRRYHIEEQVDCCHDWNDDHQVDCPLIDFGTLDKTVDADENQR